MFKYCVAKMIYESLFTLRLGSCIPLRNEFIDNSLFIIMVDNLGTFFNLLEVYPDGLLS